MGSHRTLSLMGLQELAMQGCHEKSQCFVGVDIVKKGSKKDFCRYNGSKRRAKRNMGPLEEAMHLAAKDTEKTEIIQMLLGFVVIH